MVRFLVACCLVLGRWSLAAESSSPRLRLSHKELWHLNRTWTFDKAGVPLGLRSMLLDESRERLFIGGRNSLYSLSLEQVNMDHREVIWSSTQTQVNECHMKGREQSECANYIKVLHHYNKTHLLACGTGAFDPMCAFIRVGRWAQDRLFHLEAGHTESGRGRCPFDPNSPCVSTFSGGDLYVGFYTDFWENDGAFCRQGNSSYTRTERDNRQQLNEPRFITSMVIPDNDDHDDDKVYFFFTEKEVDGESGSKAVYSRIGRVCANDVGGQRMLVNKWSTFLKSRLICSVPGPNGIDTHFDKLEDVFVLKKRDKRSPEIFGLFSTTSNVFKGYAVCVYVMDDIRAAFNGPYAHRERAEHHWTAFEGKIPYPRPGTCASKVNGGSFSSSRDFPDEVLRFARAHPAMLHPVMPLHRRPVLMQTDGDRLLTQIAVNRVEAEDGHYDVLFVGTDDAVVLKIMTIYNKEDGTVEQVPLEELHVFKVPVPITEILISAKRQQLYIGSDLGVAQVKVCQCHLYGPACADCCLARDPYCAWDGVTCTRYYPASTTSKRRFRRQDVRHGNAEQQCSGLQISGEQWERADENLVYGIENNSTLLECRPRSPQAKVLWFKHRGLGKTEVQTDERVVRTIHGLLFLHLLLADSGTYQCLTVEHGFVRPYTKIVLRVLETESVQEMLHCGETKIKTGDGTEFKRPHVLHNPNRDPTSKLWFKEFHQLLGSDDFFRVEDYCERVWCPDWGRRKRPSLQPKWKHSQVAERRGKVGTDQRRRPRHLQET